VLPPRRLRRARGLSPGTRASRSAAYGHLCASDLTDMNDPVLDDDVRLYDSRCRFSHTYERTARVGIDIDRLIRHSGIRARIESILILCCLHEHGIVDDMVVRDGLTASGIEVTDGRVGITNGSVIRSEDCEVFGTGAPVISRGEKLSAISRIGRRMQ
jgi:hypothetical protein